MGLKDRIKKKLKNYKIPLNKVDEGLPEKLLESRRVAVIGGGIAGISTASSLAEAGFETHLFESAPYLGGKVGSWTFESKGESLRTEHGFHAFFRQYYNLRDFMKKIGAYDHLIPIDDYLILYDQNKKQGFEGLETTPGLNILALRKHGVYGIGTLVNPLSAPLLHLLRFDPVKTFRKFDNTSFERFARRTRLPSKMKLVFNSFARAFFSEPDQMSMAEMIKSFHFYFLSNDEGLVYDVLNDDFEHTFLEPCRKFMEAHGAELHLNTPVGSIGKTEQGFEINGGHFDYAVLCTDVKAARSIIGRSPDLHRFPGLHRQLANLPSSGRYAVYRLWTDRFEDDKTLPFFVFTDRLKCLDSVTLYHKMEKESAKWSASNKGGIFELHSYSIPAGLADAEAVKASLMEEFYHYFPELEGMEIRHEYFQLRDDFPGFQTGAHADRPTVRTEDDRLFLAGDWVKLDNASMLMEAAYTSGAQAANEIRKQEGLRQNQLYAVPEKGLFA